MLLCRLVIGDNCQYVGKSHRYAHFSMLNYLAQPWNEMIQEGCISQVGLYSLSGKTFYHQIL